MARIRSLGNRPALQVGPFQHLEFLIVPSAPAQTPYKTRLVVLTSGGDVSPGRVWLVGAGPGDPELLTVKAAKVIQTAAVIVHDGLVSEAILALAPAEARMISVAKRKSRHSYAQDEINAMLVAFALDGLTVVRLKGGDPFIFGRGGEEVEACRAAGVECIVIPGVTAALAAGAAAGAPLTHRGAAQAVTFVTGHATGGAAPDLDWADLAKPNRTVVFYMSLTTAAAVSAKLIDAGRAASTPALIVENASLANERCVPTTVGALGAAAEGVFGPALLIVGEAMALARESFPPLHGEGDSRSERGGALEAAPTYPTPDAASRRLDPRHKGEGGTHR